MVNKLGIAPANKILFLSSVRPHRAKANMFCQDVALKKSIAKSVYFFGSLDRLYLRAKFAYQMRKLIPSFEVLLKKNVARARACLHVRVRAAIVKQSLSEHLASVLSNGEKCFAHLISPLKQKLIWLVC